MNWFKDPCRIYVFCVPIPVHFIVTHSLELIICGLDFLTSADVALIKHGCYRAIGSWPSWLPRKSIFAVWKSLNVGNKLNIIHWHHCLPVTMLIPITANIEVRSLYFKYYKGPDAAKVCFFPPCSASPGIPYISSSCWSSWHKPVKNVVIVPGWVSTSWESSMCM